MEETVEDEYALRPPDANRVAARTLVLSAIACRGLIEQDATKPETEVFRQNIVEWLDFLGLTAEIEPAETALLLTPLGKLDRKMWVNAGWQSEGMVVLAWALHRAELPAVHIQCDPSETANGFGFLEGRAATPLNEPLLRDSSEIEEWADTYLTLHWRLRQYREKPEPMDFVSYVSQCNWATLRLDHLEIVDNDLAIDGVRIDRVDEAKFRNTLSITQERHQAFNWLLGFEILYSDVTTDT